jgi:hypothetical protein
MRIRALTERIRPHLTPCPLLSHPMGEEREILFFGRVTPGAARRLALPGAIIRRPSGTLRWRVREDYWDC